MVPENLRAYFVGLLPSVSASKKSQKTTKWMKSKAILGGDEKFTTVPAWLLPTIKLEVDAWVAVGFRRLSLLLVRWPQNIAV